MIRNKVEIRMKSLKSVWMLLYVLLGLTVACDQVLAASDTIFVWIPDTTANQGDTVSIPVMVDEILISSNVQAYDIRIEYDSSVVETLWASSSGTISSGGYFIWHDQGDSLLRVANAVITPPMSGSGALFNINIVVRDDAIPGAITYLAFTRCKFNEFFPASHTTDGSLEVNAEIRIEIENDSVNVDGGHCTVAINVLDPLDGLNVQSFELGIVFDTNFVTPGSVITDEAMCDSWGEASWDVSADTLLINHSGVDPLTGTGALLSIFFSIQDAASDGDSMALQFSSAMFNDSNPSTFTDDGVLWFIAYPVVGLELPYREIKPSEGQFDYPIELISNPEAAPVYSFDFKILFDTILVNPVSATCDATICESWGSPQFEVSRDTVKISHAGTPAVDVIGYLALIKFGITDEAATGSTFELMFVSAILNDGNPLADADSGTIRFDEVLAAEDDLSEGIHPTYSEVAQNYPNPFNPETVIRFQIKRTGAVSLVVYNVLGERVTTLVDGMYAPGTYEAKWDGKYSDGESASSGIYFYRFEAGDQVDVRKMLLLK